ncbi:MAG: hypothetical protein QOH90_1206 [Actinomycetota bacterium]|nr:hypothetical protein [Actinomycetota bacterium]
MPNLDAVYDATRADVTDLLLSLSDEQLDTSVPATPDWTIKNIATHLAADATCVINGDFPTSFFDAFGEPEAVAQVNGWTAGQLADREGRTLGEILAEWDESAKTVSSMMRGEQDWAEGMPWFADRVLLTDVAVHQQDIYGALGIEKDRESVQVKVGLAGYIGTMDFRLKAAGAPAMRFEAGEKSWVAGEGEPAATLRSNRWELFRAMSGRRNPGQIGAYDWTGDPEPFIPFFYPYGVRADALVE